MQSRMAMHLSPRCGARTRKGTPCQSPAVTGKTRCRMHGGGRGSGGQRGNRNAFKHGNCSEQAIATRREIAELVRASRSLVTDIK